MSQTVRIEGLAELARALQELPRAVSRNVLRGAVNAGATVIRKEVIQRAPEFHGDVSKGHPPPGTLRKSVRQSFLRNESNERKTVYVVSVRRKAFYWRFLEFGTAHQPANPFFRPAFEAKKMSAVEAIRDYLAKRIPLEAEKLNPKK